MVLCQTSSSRTTSNLILPQSKILESQNATSAADGATIEPRTPINPRDDESARCSVSRVRAQPRNFFQLYAAASNTFNVQRHLISARTHRVFRAAAMNVWREAV